MGCKLGDAIGEVNTQFAFILTMWDVNKCFSNIRGMQRDSFILTMWDVNARRKNEFVIPGRLLY